MFQGSFATRLAAALAPLAVVGVVLAVPGVALADHQEDYVAYYGPHPIAASHGGGWCNDASKHYHAFEPEDYYLYSEYDGALYFIGDPTDFGWSGTRYA